MIVVWSLGGLIALTGSLTFAELGGRFPKSGGVYVYLKEAYGDLVGFLYGWCILTVVTSGAIAALSIAFATYLGHFISLTQTQMVGVAVACIVFLTAINVVGVQYGNAFAKLFTLFKLLGIAMIIFIGLAFLFSMKSSWSFEFNSTSFDLADGLALGLVGVLWSYGGWHHASYIAGEVIDAKRVVPRAMIAGALVVGLVYVLSNVAYMSLLTVDEIASSTRVASEAMWPFGAGAAAVAFLILISVFGTTGIYTLTAPRIYHAMARDGVFFPFLSKIHPKFRTPLNAIVLQSAWAIVLLLFWGTFADLITYVVFIDFLFMMLAAFALFLFRRRKTETDGPRTWLYPLPPIIFCLTIAWFIYQTLLLKPDQAWAGLILLVAGIPFYLVFKKSSG